MHDSHLLGGLGRVAGDDLGGHILDLEAAQLFLRRPRRAHAPVRLLERRRAVLCVGSERVQVGQYLGWIVGCLCGRAWAYLALDLEQHVSAAWLGRGLG